MSGADARTNTEYKCSGKDQGELVGTSVLNTQVSIPIWQSSDITMYIGIYLHYTFGQDPWTLNKCLKREFLLETLSCSAVQMHHGHVSSPTRHSTT